MPTLKVKSLEELLVDGKNQGPVISAVTSGGLDPKEAQRALEEWRDDFLRAKASELQEAELARQQAIEVANTNQDAAQSLQDQLEAKQAQAESLQTELDSAKAELEAAKSISTEEQPSDTSGE